MMMVCSGDEFTKPVIRGEEPWLQEDIRWIIRFFEHVSKQVIEKGGALPEKADARALENKLREKYGKDVAVVNIGSILGLPRIISENAVEDLFVPLDMLRHEASGLPVEVFFFRARHSCGVGVVAGDEPYILEIPCKILTDNVYEAALTIAGLPVYQQLVYGSISERVARLWPRNLVLPVLAKPRDVIGREILRRIEPGAKRSLRDGVYATTLDILVDRIVEAKISGENVGTELPNHLYALIPLGDRVYMVRRVWLMDGYLFVDTSPAPIGGEREEHRRRRPLEA